MLQCGNETNAQQVAMHDKQATIKGAMRMKMQIALQLQSNEKASFIKASKSLKIQAAL